jgi:hypothetical protein
MILFDLRVCVMCAHAIDFLEHIPVLLQYISVLRIQMRVICAFHVNKVGNTLLIVVRLLHEDRVTRSATVISLALRVLLAI